MTTTLFSGERIRLIRVTDEHLPPFAGWLTDFGVQRFVNPGAVAPMTPEQLLDPNGWMAADRNNPDNFLWAIHTLDDDTFIGITALTLTNPVIREYEFGINIGHPDYRSRGYGVDIMRVVLRFGFTQLNSPRITLTVASYNPRAIRLYEKMGFVLEATGREVTYRDNVYHDELYMAILKREWEAHHVTRS